MDLQSAAISRVRIAFPQSLQGRTMNKSEPPQSGAVELQTLKLQLPPDLLRAYHRCSWVIINQTGRDQLSIMEEMVRDFLIKHGC